LGHPVCRAYHTGRQDFSLDHFPLAISSWPPTTAPALELPENNKPSPDTIQLPKNEW